MELKLAASNSRKKAAFFFAGAGSCVLHAVLAAGFLYCLPEFAGSGEGSPLALSLHALPGKNVGAEAVCAQGAEQPAELHEALKTPQTHKAQVMPAQTTADRMKRKAASEKKSEERRAISDFGSDSSSGGSTSAEASSATGEGQAAVPFGYADVPFGRSCGPAFARFSRPVYPLQARRAGISGLVRLRVSLDDSGGVRDIEVLESGHRLLVDAACAAIRRSSFRPYTQNGKSLPSRTVIPIRFSLEQAL